DPDPGRWGGCASIHEPGRPPERRDRMADPLRCGLRLVDAENARDIVRYHSLLHDDFRGEVDGEVVSWSADDHAVAGVRSWAAEPEARVVVDSAEVAGGSVLLRYRVVRPGGGETPGSLVLEVHGDRIRRSWRYGASGRAPERRP